MKARNARYLDDLLSGDRGGSVYKHIRDGHSADIAEILAGLERLLPDEKAVRGMVNFAYMMLEARGTRGSDEARNRDKTAAQLRAGMRTEELAHKRSRFH
jgi:hypothetical protein